MDAVFVQWLTSELLRYALASANGGDSLSDHNVCLRDAALLQRLGINTIHVPFINPSLSHNECISIFDAVGIYICVDLTGNMTDNTPAVSAPDITSVYNFELIQNMYMVIDFFKDYENLLGFWVSNTVFGVGQTLETTPGFLRCPGNGKVDGTNGTFNQQWSSSVWQDYTHDFAASSAPIIFSLYGYTNPYTPEERDFHDTLALYNPDYMATTFSGGILNQWVLDIREVTDSGLVYLDSEGNAQLKKDYNTFSSVINQFDLQELKIPSLSFDDAWILPTAPPGVQDLILYGNNGTRGRLVPVTQTDVTHTVQDASGTIMTGLSITTSLLGAMASSRPLSSPSSTGSSQTNEHNEALKLGAGIGIPFVLLLGTILGVLLCLQLRMKRREAVKDVGRRAPRKVCPRELECTTYAGQPELHDQHLLHELDSSTTFVELDTEDFGHELY
ncbi:hypothetical protein MMC18_001053 [Xylographa bjoerkii]|nr:hypothetical protein [Xylographa bjoerkii]